MPEGQTPVADNSEQFEPTWITPQQAVLRYEKERLDIDKLALSGKGTWRGEG